MVPYKDIFLALDKHKIRYLVAGGFAVNFHNVQRLTADLDLILHLEENNILEFAKMMTSLGFIPRVPVKAEEFADANKRQEWMDHKNMKVFSFINASNPMELVDIFIKEPKPFYEMVSRQLIVDAYGVKINVVGLDDLIAMKVTANREKDLFDIKLLQRMKP